MWGFQHYLFLGIGDVKAGFEKEQWSGTCGPCMMAYTEMGKMLNMSGVYGGSLCLGLVVRRDI